VDDQQRLRYSRHLLLNEFGEDAQERLLDSHALVVGAGGLGSSALLYLASSGLGRITVCDGDRVDLTNLQRQVVHRVDSIGEPKARSAARTLAAINPEVRIEALEERAGEARIAELVQGADVVLDCSDNFATRHALNRACVGARKPLVSGAAIRFDGQVAVFDLRRDDAPCYHCLFAEDAESPDERCATMGIFAARGHRRHVPGAGGDQARRARGRNARRAPAPVRCARQPLARGAARPRCALPRVREAARRSRLGRMRCENRSWESPCSPCCSPRFPPRRRRSTS